MKKSTLLAALILGATTSTFAAGFGIYEVTSRGTAMGGALVGRTGDASAVYFNPANQTQVEGTTLSLGTHVIAPRGKMNIQRGENGISQAGKADLDKQYFVVPAGFISHQLTDDIWIGLGNYTEYGLGTEYDPFQYVGRYNALYTKLETMTFSPTIAYKVNDKLSLGAGLRVMYIKFTHGRALPTAHPAFPGDSKFKVNADDISLGYYLGLNYAITDDLDFGLVYRSKVEHKLHGKGQVSGPIEGVAGVTGLSTESDGNGKITLPQSLTAGLNWAISDNWSVGTALTWTEWSSFDALTLVFDDPNFAISQGKPVTSPKNWSNVYRLGFGTEYKLNENWAVQGSYVFDMAPNDKDNADFLIPPGDRHILGAGVSYTTGKITYNFGYNFLMMVNGKGTAETIPHGGDKANFKCDKAYSHIVSASINFAF